MGPKKITTLFLVSLLPITAVVFQNCAPAEHDGLMSSSSLGVNSVEIFEQTLKPVLITNCGACHGVSQAPLHAVSNSEDAHDLIMGTSLINTDDAANSRLVVKVRGGHFSIATSVADEMEAQITSWIQQAGDGDNGVQPAVLEPTFKSINALILQPKCATCHNPNGTRPQEDYSNYQTTMATGKLGSDFWGEIVSDSMPTGPNAQPLSVEEKFVIRTWLDSGAPNN